MSASSSIPSTSTSTVGTSTRGQQGEEGRCGRRLHCSLGIRRKRNTNATGRSLAPILQSQCGQKGVPSKETQPDMSLCDSFWPDVPHPPPKKKAGPSTHSHSTFKNEQPSVFPGGLVARIRAFTALAQVQSPVRELRLHKLCGAWLKKKKKRKKRMSSPRCLLCCDCTQPKIGLQAGQDP